MLFDLLLQSPNVTAPPAKRAMLAPLTAEQTRVLKAVEAGHNVFFTGMY